MADSNGMRSDEDSSAQLDNEQKKDALIERLNKEQDYTSLLAQELEMYKAKREAWKALYNELMQEINEVKQKRNDEEVEARKLLDEMQEYLDTLPDEKANSPAKSDNPVGSKSSPRPESSDINDLESSSNQVNEPKDPENEINEMNESSKQELISSEQTMTLNHSSNKLNTSEHESSSSTEMEADCGSTNPVPEEQVDNIIQKKSMEKKRRKKGKMH